MMQKTFGKATLEIVEGDITALAVDAIVNAANVRLQHGGGVAAAIARKGGPAIQRESNEIIRKLGRSLHTGEAVLTGGGDLPARFVIHVAGPVWGEQSEEESDRLLRLAVRNSLALADERKLKSIALPAISTGIYGFPLERAAKQMLHEAADYLRGESGLQRVVFCLFGPQAYRAFAQAWANP
jgi:O-acetyl-ADP-ribose deacetylase (regulator of RNase III)